jgi:hypothetical protein
MVLAIGEMSGTCTGELAFDINSSLATEHFIERPIRQILNTCQELVMSSHSASWRLQGLVKFNVKRS